MTTERGKERESERERKRKKDMRGRMYEREYIWGFMCTSKYICIGQNLCTRIHVGGRVGIYAWVGICMKEGIITLCFHCVGIELRLSIDRDFWSSRGGAVKGKRRGKGE